MKSPLRILIKSQIFIIIVTLSIFTLVTNTGGGVDSAFWWSLSSVVFIFITATMTRPDFFLVHVSVTTSAVAGLSVFKLRQALDSSFSLVTFIVGILLIFILYATMKRVGKSYAILYEIPQSSVAISLDGEFLCIVFALILFYQ